MSFFFEHILPWIAFGLLLFLAGVGTLTLIFLLTGKIEKEMENEK